MYVLNEQIESQYCEPTFSEYRQEMVENDKVCLTTEAVRQKQHMI
jgi:hypothetical protein